MDESQDFMTNELKAEFVIQGSGLVPKNQELSGFPVVQV